MGLDSYIFDDTDSDITNHKEIAYWRKNWFLHEAVACRQDDSDFNCIRFYLDKDTLQDIYSELCDEADKQNRSLKEVEYYDEVRTCDIDELKKAIKYLNNNPKAKLYFYSWY